MSPTIAPTPSEETITVGRTTMLGDLLALVVDELRMLPGLWVKLPEDTQGKTIDRIKERLEPIIGDCVRHIASSSRTALRAKVMPFSVKEKSLEPKLSVAKTHESGRALVDAVGTECVIILPSVEDYLGGAEKIKPEPTQRALELDKGEATGGATKRGPGRPRKSDTAASAPAAETKPSADDAETPKDALQQAADHLEAASERPALPERTPNLNLLQEDPAKAHFVTRPYVIRPEGKQTEHVIGVWAKDPEDAMRLFRAGYEDPGFPCVAEGCYRQGFASYGCLNPYHAPPAGGSQGRAS